MSVLGDLSLAEGFWEAVLLMGEYTHPSTSQPSNYLEVTTIQVTVEPGLQENHQGLKLQWKTYGDNQQSCNEKGQAWKQRQSPTDPKLSQWASGLGRGRDRSSVTVSLITGYSHTWIGLGATDSDFRTPKDCGFNWFMIFHFTACDSFPTCLIPLCAHKGWKPWQKDWEKFRVGISYYFWEH